MINVMWLVIFILVVGSVCDARSAGLDPLAHRNRIQAVVHDFSGQRLRLAPLPPVPVSLDNPNTTEKLGQINLG